ncbi:MAG TPA: hypothetical protein VNO86_02835 [Candidatus Binatia bacterium]|nr:hypothetical protein [Candidatus Binatia bacterium]
MGEGVVGFVIVVAALGALVALVELGLFDWSPDVRPLDTSERRQPIGRTGRRRMDDR